MSTSPAAATKTTSTSPPLSIRSIKQTVRRTAHLTAAEARAQKLPALIAALQSKDQDEGVAAFREKRQPVWQGR